MKPEEAIQLLGMAVPMMVVTQQGFERFLQAREMAIDALKKEIPMKPIVTLPNFKKGIPFSIDCPTCGNYLTTKVKRCEGCGQLIDWSDYETDT